ncbi:MAG: LuxR C-terminal-related transcriptional regulator [Solirubrobacteraceae bacterium]
MLALAVGKTNKQIADTLGISAKTAGHRSSTSSTRPALEPEPQRRSGRSNATSCHPPNEQCAPSSRADPSK